MGYPMTYQRLVNRNRLRDGDYSLTPRAWMTSEAGGVVPGLTNDRGRRGEGIHGVVTVTCHLYALSVPGSARPADAIHKAG